jgi:tetratricopeptide (TPR) repeat protein
MARPRSALAKVLHRQNMRIVTRRNLEADLASVESRLQTQSGSLDLQANRARLLFELGRIEEAKFQYLAILKRDPRHFSALNNLAVLLQQTGFTSAASIAYTVAITHHPGNPIGHTNFGDLLVGQGELETARAHYETALRIAPDHINAHRGLAEVCWLLGDAQRARHHQTLQYQGRPLETYPYLGTGVPVPLLLLMSANVGNLPWVELIDNRVFQTVTIAVEFYERSKPLPPHRLIFNAIGDADVCRPALEAAIALVAQSTAPVINSPAAVLRTGRLSNSERLRDLPGVVTPRMVRMPRTLLAGPEGLAALSSHNLAFPLLLRRAGFHTGQHFVRVDSPDALASAAGGLPGDELLVMEYLDARGRDGKSRKYRVMSIGGQLYPLHLAISEQWKVHYFSAEMAENPEHQAEEANFLNDMPRVLGPKAMRALEHIRDSLGLDYWGIDFGLGRHGEILLFEANATMLVRPPGPAAQWDYRRAAIGGVLQAARRLLFERAGVQVVAQAHLRGGLFDAA